MIVKPKYNYFVDVGLAIAFFSSVITGFFKWPGLRSKFGIEHDTMATISTIHDYSGLIMALLVLVHLIFHWNWIVAMTKKIVFRKN